MYFYREHWSKYLSAYFIILTQVNVFLKIFLNLFEANTAMIKFFCLHFPAQYTYNKITVGIIGIVLPNLTKEYPP